MDALWKAIVPLGILAIWALTALFNRDAKPLPGRVGAPPSPYGPKPPTPGGTRVVNVDRSPTLRWAPQQGGAASTTARASSRTLGNDDDIVILDSPRPARTVAPRQPTAPGRRARSKPVAPTRGGSPAPPAHQTTLGSSNINQSLSKQTLSEQMSDERKVEQRSGNLASTETPRAVAVSSMNDMRATAPSAASILSLFGTPEQLRNALVMSEVLGPPVSMRKGRRQV